MTPSAETCLATYGTLAPGRVNAHVLADLRGAWLTGAVRGRLVEAGWGARLGYPGLILDPMGAEIPVDILHSPDLPSHWPRLDAFEGAGYRRAAATAATTGGVLIASIYVLAH